MGQEISTQPISVIHSQNLVIQIKLKIVSNVAFGVLHFFKIFIWEQQPTLYHRSILLAEG